MDGDATATGLIMVSDDEARLMQLSAFTALAMQNLKARQTAEFKTKEMETIFSALTDAVIVFDAGGKPTKSNPAAVGVFDFDPLSPNGRQILDKLSIRYPNGKSPARSKHPAARKLKGETMIDECFRFKNLDLDIREDDIPETLKIVLYRILQEAMNNAAK